MNCKSCKSNRGNCVELEPAGGVIAAILNAVEVDVVCITFIDILTSAICYLHLLSVICITFIHVLTSAICQHNTSILWFKRIYALLQIVR